MSKKAIGCLRPEEKQDLQLKKNELIRNAILCVKNFDLDKEEIDVIIRMIISLTYHSVSGYLERTNELNEQMYVLRGIYSKHVSKVNPSPFVKQTMSHAQPQEPSSQPNNIINDYNDWR